MHGEGCVCVLRQDITSLSCSKKDVWEDCGISNASFLGSFFPENNRLDKYLAEVKEVK